MAKNKNGARHAAPRVLPPPPPQPQPQAPAEFLDVGVELANLRNSLETAVKRHAALPLALIVGQMHLTIDDIVFNTRMAQNREALRRQAEAEAQAVPFDPKGGG